MSAVPAVELPKKPNGSEALVVQIPTPMDLLQQAIARDVDIERLAKLMELQMAWEQNEARKAFVQAMAKFKENAPVIVKDKVATIRSRKSEGSSFSYKYAALDKACHEIAKALSAVGISHRWKPEDVGPDMIRVTCILRHELGHSEETSMQGNVERSEFINPMQCRGVTLSYLERYTLFAACGVAPMEDTDGAVPQAKLEKQQIPDERYVLLRDGIRNAGDMDELQRLYKSACAEATAIGDEESRRDFNKAKNDRYKELYAAR